MLDTSLGKNSITDTSKLDSVGSEQSFTLLVEGSADGGSPSASSGPSLFLFARELSETKRLSVSVAQFADCTVVSNRLVDKDLYA